MYKIAICEDEMTILFGIEKEVKAYGQSAGEDLEIKCYMDGAEMIEALGKNGEHFDLLLLDIEMPLRSGIEVAKYLRNDLSNEDTQIVFISSKTQYAMELFEVRPLHFLVKPVNQDTLAKVLKKGIELTQKHELIFTYQINRTTFRIPYKDILYFMSKGREVVMVTKNNKETFYAQLGDIYQQLHEAGFFYIHKSILVNYHQIKGFGSSDILLNNQETLKVSKGRRKEYMEIQQIMEG